MKSGKVIVRKSRGGKGKGKGFFAGGQTPNRRKKKSKKGIHEIAKRLGIDLTKVRESQAEFDVLTGKPLCEE